MCDQLLQPDRIIPIHLVRSLGERAKERLSLGFGLPQTDHTIPGFPQAALFQQRNPFKALEHASLRAKTSGNS